MSWESEAGQEAKCGSTGLGMGASSTGDEFTVTDLGGQMGRGPEKLLGHGWRAEVGAPPGGAAHWKALGWIGMWRREVLMWDLSTHGGRKPWAPRNYPD